MSDGKTYHERLSPANAAASAPADEPVEQRAYRPRPGTFQAQVVDWIEQRPGWHRTRDIADAFGISPKHVCCRLRDAVHGGAILKCQSEGIRKTKYARPGTLRPPKTATEVKTGPASIFELAEWI